MFFLLIHYAFSFYHPIKNIFIGNWSIRAKDISHYDYLEKDHIYHLNFLEYKELSVIGDLVEHFNNSKSELLTTIKIQFSDLFAIVWTGSLRYFYKLINFHFVRSHNQIFFAQGEFIDGTGYYIFSLYSSTRADLTIYEKDKVTFYSMEKYIDDVPFLWMSKYFYFIPVTVFLFIIALLPCNKKRQKKSMKKKVD